MQIKQKIHAALRTSGWYVKRRDNLPTGIDWILDVQRKLGKNQIEMILDVGANIGQTALQVAKEFPRAKIHCFEPILDTYTELQKNTITYSSINCHNLALGDHQGSQDIIAVPLAETNSLVSGRLDNDPKGKKATINISTLDIFCDENNVSEISILKTDTEGYDLQVLQGSRKMLEASKIAAIYIEVTFKQESKMQTFFPDVLEFLDSFGMRFIGIYETEPLSRTSDSPDLYCNALFLNEIQMHNERKSR